MKKGASKKHADKDSAPIKIAEPITVGRGRAKGLVTLNKYLRVLMDNPAKPADFLISSM